jgi:hypothetical protein
MILEIETEDEPIAQLWIPRHNIHFISENKTMHHFKLARARKDWQQLTMAAVYNIGVVRPLPAVLIYPTFRFNSVRRRDPVNFMPTIKPIIDQLVHRGWWPDDTPEYVNYGTPGELVTPGQPEGVILTLFKRTDQA